MIKCNATLCALVLCFSGLAGAATGFLASPPTMPARYAPMHRSCPNMSQCSSDADCEARCTPAPQPSTLHNHDIRILRLERRVNALTAAVQDICSAVMYCDDVALMEHNARAVGDIYLDSQLQTIRRPRLLRQEVGQIMLRHNISGRPLMNSWSRVPRAPSAADSVD